MQEASGCAKTNHNMSHHRGELYTKLITKSVDNISDAAAHMGELDVRNGFQYSPMVLVPRDSGCGLYITIPEGFHAVVTANGRYLGLWNPGFHWARPWESVTHLVTKQYVVFDAPIKECPTKDNVMVQIDVSVVISVDDSEEGVYNFVYKLGPERLEDMLKAYTEEAVRQMARQKKFSTIYDLMDADDTSAAHVHEETEHKHPLPTDVPQSTQAEPTAPGIELASVPAEAKEGEDARPKDPGHEVARQLENTKRVMNSRLKEYGVSVYSITIVNVRLPTQFRTQMESATTYTSKNLKAAAEQKYNLQVIGNNEDRAKAQLTAEQNRKSAHIANEQKMAEEQRMTNKLKADTDVMIAQIKQDLDAAVLKIKSENELAVAKLDKERDIELAEIEAQAAAEARQIKAEAEAYVLRTRAQAEAAVAKNEAEITSLRAEAEAIAAAKLKSKREFDALMSQLHILKNLAENKKMTLTSTDKDNPLGQWLAARGVAATLGLTPQ